MFAQHMLRKTGRNYATAASLDEWSVTAVERIYGKPPEQQVRKWAWNRSQTSRDVRLWLTLI